MSNNHYRNNTKMTKKYMPYCIGALLGIVSFTAQADNVQPLNRYATLSLEPTVAQKKPLMAVSQFKFQSDVVTVGDAVNQVLNSTGYSLVGENKMANITIETLQKPLPMVDRTIGPMSVQSILLVLMGDIFDIQVDLGHRLVNFTVKPAYKKLYR